MMTPPTPQKSDPRRAKIAKIKVACKMLAIEDGAYRALLKRVTGVESCADMSVRQLDAVLDEFKALGFKAKKKRAGGRKQADGAQAAKIRALWIGLYHMGAVKDTSEHALSLFARRTCYVEDLHWIDARHADQIIRALRGWMTRLGYHHPSAVQTQTVAKIREWHRPGTGGDADVIAAKINMVAFQSKALEYAVDMSSLILLESAELDAMIEDLGGRIRR